MMNDADLQQLTRNIARLGEDVGKFLKNEIHQLKKADVEEKGIHNLVTYVDKAAEKKLVDALGDLLPEAGFIAEEGTSTKVGEDYNWIIDPLDGTTNFIHGVPLYAVSLALQYHHEIIIGVIYEPNLQECFYTWKGAPSFLNGRKIQVSDTTIIDQALFATGFPYHDYDQMKQFMKLFEYFMRYSRGLRRLGTAAMDLAYVACGRYDGFFEYGLNAWDVAAGTLIVQNAGGKNMDFRGGDDYIFGGEIVSVNPHLADDFGNIVKKHFY